GDFVLWGTAYGEPVPATGSGFIYTALDPVLRPPTPGQEQLTAALTGAYVDNVKAQAPAVPAAESSLTVTTRGRGVAVAPNDEGGEQPQQDKPAQSSSEAVTDAGK
ncbi:MAG TPA: hypothetical protein VN462_01550, partial [Negativicutes bacterium]|nr:hypothetical protein [Negativicutes bacterium]